jgi:hypothetical protein
MVAIITVCVFPPRESCKSLVSFESLYGIWVDLPSTKADITLPKALNERLIRVVSLRPTPAIFNLLCLSDPAKSTKLSLPDLYN